MGGRDGWVVWAATSWPEECLGGRPGLLTGSGSEYVFGASGVSGYWDGARMEMEAEPCAGVVRGGGVQWVCAALVLEGG